MRSGKVRNEHPNPQKRKKCCRSNVILHLPSTPEKWTHPSSPTAITAATSPLAADPSNPVTLKSQLSVVHTPHSCPSKRRESSLLDYFKKKPGQEPLENTAENALVPGWGVSSESAVIDALPMACGYSTTVAQVHCPALSTFSQSGSQDEVCHSPPYEGQPAVFLPKHNLLPIIISSDHSFNVGEWESPLVASPAVLLRQDWLAGRRGTWRPVRELVHELSDGREAVHYDTVAPASGSRTPGTEAPERKRSRIDEPRIFGRIAEKTAGEVDELGKARAPAKAAEERSWKRASDSSVWTEAVRGVRRGRRYTSRCSLCEALLERPGLPLRKELNRSWRRGVGDCTSVLQGARGEMETFLLKLPITTLEMCLLRLTKEPYAICFQPEKLPASGI
ncbi:hypothetical protein NDU88_005714 [Pleurodeles waltl]|uniref:Uncharacterized protein n=1 Tax=Pleurodeles waltl TaxID=8319 RepID=A0AAV7TVJ3_PLEWA|nr:hypothetical protein NDU88_005714 [Pleurodeles waltl]